MGRAGRLAGVLVLADVGFRFSGNPAEVGARSGIPALGDRGRPGYPGLFPDHDHFLRESVQKYLAGASRRGRGDVPTRWRQPSTSG